MARSLARSTELFISVNDNSLVAAAPENLFAVKVLDGYSFSQDVTTQEVGVNEAGSSTVRGTQGFNTALNPVDVSFSTYVRSHSWAENIQGTPAAGSVDCVERVLWASAMGDKASWDTVVGGTGAASAEVITGQSTTSIDFSLNKSNTNTLMPLTLYFKLENTTYVIQQFNVSSAEVDFSIDGIATINWTGQGSRVTESQSDHATLAGFGLTNPNSNYKSVPTTTTTTFLRNKLSTLTLKNNATATGFVDAVAVAGISNANKTITMASTNALTVNKFSNGRIKNSTVNPVQWATVISNTNDIVTVANSEDISGWSDADVVVLYTALEDSGVIYTVPITGATITLENNFTYLTPEELAIVNLPLAGFSGNRIISGSLTAYLNTGAQGTGGLLQDMLVKIEGSVTNSYELVFHMGGQPSATTRVEFTLPTCQLAIPTTNVEDLISTEISFTSKPSIGTGAGTGSFEATNELVIKYFN